MAGGDNPSAVLDSSVQPDQATLSPHVAVTGNNQPILNGSTTPTPVNDTAFGTTVPGATLSETYTIMNSGTAPLSVGPVVIGGADATDFTVETQPGSVVAVGGNTTFTVEFTPTTSGTLSATLSFSTNDPSLTGPFTFAISGVAISTTAQITVSAGGQPIIDGSTMPSASNGTVFNTTVVGNTSSVTYAIANSGTTSLTLGTVSISGTNAADFTVTKQPNSLVTPHGSTTFTVEFKPTAAGTPTATVSFTQSDPNLASPFTFAISGTATTKQPHINVSGAGQPITDGSITPDLANGTVFSTTAVGKSSFVTFSIANNGSAPLDNWHRLHQRNECRRLCRHKAAKQLGGGRWQHDLYR